MNVLIFERIFDLGDSFAAILTHNSIIVYNPLCKLLSHDFAIRLHKAKKKNEDDAQRLEAYFLFLPSNVANFCHFFSHNDKKSATANPQQQIKVEFRFY